MAVQKKSQPGDTVAISCRAHENCHGQQATLLRVAELPGPIPGLSGGTKLVYRCLSCKRQFSITY